MIHATLRAIAYLRGEDPNNCTPLVSACDGRDVPLEDRLVILGHVSSAEGHRFRLPTCPECLVLWDAALESGTPPAPRPAHGPETGGSTVDGC